MKVQIPVRVDLAGIQLLIIRPDILQKKLNKIAAKGQAPVIEFVIPHGDSPAFQLDALTKRKVTADGSVAYRRMVTACDAEANVVLALP